MNAIYSILFAVALSVFGQLFVKNGLNLIGLELSNGFWQAYYRLLFVPKVIIGVLSYTCSIFFWIYALSKVDLSYAFPFLSLSYVLIMIASYLFLGEQIPVQRWIGIIFICTGVFVIART